MAIRNATRSSYAALVTGLVYEVRDSEVLVLVAAVGRRERDAVYLAAIKR
jgi:hypothetical protein